MGAAGAECKSPGGIDIGECEQPRGLEGTGSKPNSKQWIAGSGTSRDKQVRECAGGQATNQETDGRGRWVSETVSVSADAPAKWKQWRGRSGKGRRRRSDGLLGFGVMDATVGGGQGWSSAGRLADRRLQVEA